MKRSKVMSLGRFDQLLYWIQERHRIFLKKERGDKPPWTDDEILQQYRFCNVRRMDDRVSRWLYEEWYQPYFNHPNMFLACCLARHFNKIETLAGIGFPKGRPTPARLERVKAIARAMKKPFNGAYIINGAGGGDAPDKIGIVIDTVIRPMLEDPPKYDTNSIEKSVTALVGRKGIGYFMAGQIVADMRWAMEGEWADRKTWAAMGPGSLRGIRLLGYAPKNQKEFTRDLTEVMKKCRRKLPSTFIDLEAIDFQNCLCEFSKYSKGLIFGRLKRRYPGK